MFQLTSSTLRQQGDTCFNYCSLCDTSISRQTSQISREHDVLRRHRLCSHNRILRPKTPLLVCYGNQVNPSFLLLGGPTCASISAVPLAVFSIDIQYFLLICVSVWKPRNPERVSETQLRCGCTNLKHQRRSSPHSEPMFFSTPQRSQVFRQQGSLLSMSMMVMAL